MPGALLSDSLVVRDLDVRNRASFYGNFEVNLDSEEETHTIINGETIVIGSLDDTNNLEIYFGF